MRSGGLRGLQNRCEPFGLGRFDSCLFRQLCCIHKHLEGILKFTSHLARQKMKCLRITKILNNKYIFKTTGVNERSASVHTGVVHPLSACLCERIAFGYAPV